MVAAKYSALPTSCGNIGVVVTGGKVVGGVMTVQHARILRCFGKDSREPNHMRSHMTKTHTSHGGEHGRLLHCVGDHVWQHTQQSIEGEHENSQT